ncbi:MAG: hypothetical protein JXR56_09260, partial [Candidatus Cloacimonetes bacterium]|nr:hypothetical protein [Candidatus Cloacimonadota bacterium]
MKKIVLFLLLAVCVIGLFAEGGETFLDAVQITTLPYSDTGNTSDNASEVANPSPDVFYRINAIMQLTNVSANMVNASTTWDTYLRVYAADMATQLWSNDDYGGTAQSAIFGMTFEANTDYYICVEGYSSSSGSYLIDIAADQTGDITSSTAPGVITNALPANGASNQATNTTLSWDFGANTETYDLYFGTNNPPVTQVVTDAVAGISGTYDPGILSNTTTYYWRVISKNTSTRTETTNPVYNFTTIAGPVTSYPYVQQFGVWPAPGFSTSGTNAWATYGTSGTPAPSIFCDFWSWATGNAAFTTPPFNATGITPALSFDWSHAYHSSYPNDALDISISTDNGANWTQIWYRTTTAFESADGAGPTNPGSFINEVVGLGAYANTTFILKFNGISGYGPNLYIDNLSVIDNSVPPSPTTLVSPADGAIDLLTGGTLQWNSAAFADGYDLYFGTDNPPTDILDG